MATFENVKAKIGINKLNKSSKQVERKKQFHNFESAKTINLIVDAREERDFEIIHEFVKWLKTNQKKVLVLAFIKKDKNTDIAFDENEIIYFTKKDINWYGKPYNKFVDEFIQNKPDILINLSISNVFSFDYVLANSKANFKISPRYKTNFADFMVDINEKPTLQNYILQVKYFLNMIKLENKL